MYASLYFDTQRKLPIPQFFDEFSNAEKCVLHMTVTALFPVFPPTVDGSHDFLLFLMLCQNFWEFCSVKPQPWHQLYIFVGTYDKLLINAYLNSFLLSFMMSNRGPLLGL